MQATILTIGDEILIGQIVDTNSVSISKHLNRAGIVVRERLSIGDDREQIVQSVERSLEKSHILIITGGLGPTKDDITKKTLCDLFGGELRYDEAVGEHVRTMLEKRGVVFIELNRGQALVRDCCTVLFNRHGTAPGMWFEREGRVVISLPGVPFEMEHLMEEEVMPRLKGRFSLRSIVHRTLITSGLAESMLAERIAPWEDALPDYLKLAYLPNPGAVRLRLSAYEVEGESVAREIAARFAELQKMLPRRQEHERFLRDHQTLYNSTTVRPAGEYNAERLETCLREILAGRNILRLKGFVNAREGSFAVNCTAEEISVEPCGREPAMLNVIGRNIDRRAVKAVLEQGANT